MSVGIYGLKSTLDYRSENLVMKIFFSDRLFADNCSDELNGHTFFYIFYISHCTSNKPIHYLLDYGDFKYGGMASSFQPGTIVKCTSLLVTVSSLSLKFILLKQKSVEMLNLLEHNLSQCSAKCCKFN